MTDELRTLFDLPTKPVTVPPRAAWTEEQRRGITTAEGQVIDVDSPIDLALAQAILSA